MYNYFMYIFLFRREQGKCSTCFTAASVDDVQLSSNTDDLVAIFAVSKHLLFFVISACGGIRTGSNLPILTAYFPVLAYGILGKSGLFVAPPLEDRLTVLTGSSVQNGTDCMNLQISMWPTARH